jgi:hypothetical protein
MLFDRKLISPDARRRLYKGQGHERARPKNHLADRRGGLRQGHRAGGDRQCWRACRAPLYRIFRATIRNKNTGMAYYRAACHFFAWVEQHELGELADIEPVHVAAYIEVLQTTAAKPTVKLHLAAIRMLFDWLVVGQILAVNAAHAVRGPKHVVRRGKTPVLTEEQARRLLENIDSTTLVGLRDRALIGVMTYAFARIGAVVSMKVEDYYPEGKRWWVRLHEKGGKRHEMPTHHKLEAFIDEYLAAADIPTGITAYLEAGGTLENAQASPFLMTCWRMSPRSAGSTLL